MAFGIKREELSAWKQAISRGEIAYLTHYWFDPRFPSYKTVTKVGCSNVARLAQWCVSHGLEPRYIHMRSPFPHFDLIGPMQKEILRKERMWRQIEQFNMR